MERGEQERGGGVEASCRSKSSTVTTLLPGGRLGEPLACVCVCVCTCTCAHMYLYAHMHSMILQ